MSDPEPSSPLKTIESGPVNWVGLLLHKYSTYAAFFGGFTLVILVAVNATSIAGRTLFASPLVGDFELVEMGCAIAISSFLPLCLLKKGNVTVDFFSARFPKTYPQLGNIYRSNLRRGLGNFLNAHDRRYSRFLQIR